MYTHIHNCSFASRVLSDSALLAQILSAIIRVIQRDAEERKTYFNPRPYFRLFVNWILDLTGPDPAVDGFNFQVSIIGDLYSTIALWVDP